jgi:replicative DNA helicase
MIDDERTALHSIEAEQALLGAILIYNEAIDFAELYVAAEYFYEPIHQFLYQRFSDSRHEGFCFDTVLTSAWLGKAGYTNIAGITLNEYVARLAASATTIINTPDYAKTIREFFDRRKLIDVADNLKSGVAGGQHAADLAATGIEYLDEIAAASSSLHNRKVDVGAAADQSIERMTFGMQNPGKLRGTPTGLSQLDRQINGLQPCDLIRRLVSASWPGRRSAAAC